MRTLNRHTYINIQTRIYNFEAKSANCIVLNEKKKKREEKRKTRKIMSSQRVNAVEKDLEKFIKFLALKSTQVVVQSRLGEKLQTQCNPLATGNDWFNLEIQDHPDIFMETKNALALGPGISILKRLPLCVEISVKTVEGDQMVLEVWSLDVITSNQSHQRRSDDKTKDVVDAAAAGLKGVAAAVNSNGTCHAATEQQTLKAAHAIYNRMGMLLKSLISLTRVTPAYKLSRCQCPEAYGIYYRIYVDRPQMHLLGDGYKCLTIGELNTIVGTLKMELSYRTKMTISPTTGPAAAGRETRKGETNAIMLKSDHFRPSSDVANSSPSQNIGLNALAFGKKGGLNGLNGVAAERKIVDIEKPLKPGAFVDLNKLRQYTEEDYVLPETPPFEWLLRRNRNESGCSGSIESLNRKSGSPVSSPLNGTNATVNNNNNTKNINLNGLNNDENNSSGSGNSENNNNNNVPTFKSFESNSENATTATATATTTTTTKTQTKASTSPGAALPSSQLSQSPLKSLLVPCAQNAAKRYSSAPYSPSPPTATGQNGHNISSCDEDNLLKELNFPFASPTSHVNELAKFLRDCYHAPPLRSLSTAAEIAADVVSSGGQQSGGVGGGCSAAVAYANVDSSDFAVIDDLSRQLEQFETSLEDYDKLVSSLTGSSSTGSRSSGGGLQMSN